MTADDNKNLIDRTLRSKDHYLERRQVGGGIDEAMETVNPSGQTVGTACTKARSLHRGTAARPRGCSLESRG